MFKKILLSLAILTSLQACSDASVASSNLSRAADNFEVTRRIVFYNGITGEYMLEVTGRCSLGKGEDINAVTITCKTGPNEYKKHYLGISNNVTFFAEQVDGTTADTSQYRVIFKPDAIVPNVEVKK